MNKPDRTVSVALYLTTVLKNTDSDDVNMYSLLTQALTECGAVIEPGWRPIEWENRYPKGCDDFQLLADFRYRTGGDPDVGKWDMANDRWVSRDGGPVHNSDCWAPSHYRPLPAPSGEMSDVR